MPSWTELLERAEPEQHLVQLYGNDDQFLAANVGRFVSEGLKRGDGLLVIATAEHSEAILRNLQDEGGLVADAIRCGRFVIMDALVTVGRLLVDGQPDRHLFESLIGGALREVQARSTSGAIRGFGEMVGLLWSQGRSGAAARLEGFWNETLEGSSCSLYCAYPIDVSVQHLENGALNLVLGSHTHMLTGPRTVVSRHSRP